MSCPDAPPSLELELTYDSSGFDPSAVNVVTLSLGMPLQQVKLTPATSFINSAVHVVPPCSNSSDPRCDSGNYGGIYNSLSSTTYSAASFTSWNGSHLAGQSTPTSTYFYELMKFSDTQSLSGVPLVTLDTMLDIPNVFGIGPNSTIITQAHTAGLITSNAWSIYTGSKTNPGSLILGGYSDRLVDGEWSGRTSDPSCPICFSVSSISLDTEYGSTPILKAGQGAFQASIEPFANYLGLPGTVYDAWIHATNASIGPQGFPSYTNSTAPEGNLTITLTSGLQVTIPSADLFTTNTINGNGTVYTPAAGSEIAKIRSASGAMGMLGFPYASKVNLMYDFDRQTVNISKAMQDVSTGGQITKICPLSGSSTTNANPAVSSALSELSERNFTGAIAGGVVGFIALLLAVIALVFIVLRHKRTVSHQRINSISSHAPIEKDGRGAFPLSNMTQQQQTPTTQQRDAQQPAELYHEARPELAATPTYELAGRNSKRSEDFGYARYELPSESPAYNGNTRSWDESTSSGNGSSTGPLSPDAKVSPRWNYI